MNKSCHTCRYHQGYWGEHFYVNECHSPNVMRKFDEYGLPLPAYCSFERCSENSCGPDGKYWEEKMKFTDPILEPIQEPKNWVERVMSWFF